MPKRPKTSNEPTQDADDEERQKLTPEQRVEKKIAKNPEDVSLYVELADMHIRADRFAEAEQVLAKALAVSGGGDLSLRERLEDVQSAALPRPGANGRAPVRDRKKPPRRPSWSRK